ncbi:MAG: AbrB/MazE/SpoVT family DNA-binding domain-containing protein [Ruminococcaceae bacterium]|nr:AbrB/MazE/SpoVT family DNA-binding domain-containing protein [Oscillospiraceae bacterium]
MKATGIVRRIDDLGRVVIPKEIRRTMRIREGDPLEIYTDAGGEVIFKKYSPLGELGTFAAQYCEALAGGTVLGVAVTDCDKFIACAGISKKEVIGTPVMPELDILMRERRSVSEGLEELKIAERSVLAASPIISAGDVMGSVVLFGTDSVTTANDSDIKLIGVAAAFLGKLMEE